MSWLKGLFGRRGIYNNLSDEIREHLDEKVEELVATGMSRKDARAAARREFGNATLVEEEGRRVWRWPSEDLLMDVRYSLRLLGKNPGFTAVAVLTLALGIGANTALFSVIDAVLLRPLPFRDPGRLVAALCTDLHDANRGGDISYPMFLDWRSQSRTFEAMSVWDNRSFAYTSGEQPESVHGAVVSADLISMLGVPPILGRGFNDDEDKLGAGQLPVILSYEFWQSHFGSDANVVGTAITLDSQKFNVVGVMPARFQFPVQQNRVELWTTIAVDQQGKNGMANQRGASYLSVVARLKPGAPIAEAQADLLAIQARLNQQYPENRPRGAMLRTEAEQITGPMRPALMILLGAVGFVLLIACANVASLLLARATVRQKEFTVRAALGASRWAMIRQLLTESVLLALAGGLLGLLFAYWATGVLIVLAPQEMARTSEIALDFRVLVFTLVVALGTGVLFGLAPALQSSRCELNRALVDGARGSSSGPSSTRLRGALVEFQLAVALVMLIGAGLLLRSFDRLLHVDPGFRVDHVLTFLLDVQMERHPAKQRNAFVNDVLQSTRALPGVESASAIFGLPLDADRGAFTALDIEGRPVPKSQRPRVAFRLVESQYFDTMKIPLLQGRMFTPEDAQSGRPLAIVNETLARRMFPGENAVGHRIQPNISFGDNDQAAMREVVGVVGDVKSGGIANDEVPEVYAPQTGTDFVGETTIVARTGNDPRALVSAVQSLVAAADKDLPLREVKTMEEWVSSSIAAPRFEVVLLGTFAGLAFVLTTIGLYGVISYSVAQRTRELGIRMVLGAQKRNIARMVLGQGALLILVGVGAGLLASFFAVRLIRGLLYGIGANDPVTFLVVPALLIGVALLASYVPARRATRVDPLEALRYE